MGCVSGRGGVHSQPSPNLKCCSTDHRGAARGIARVAKLGFDNLLTQDINMLGGSRGFSLLQGSGVKAASAPSVREYNGTDRGA